MKRILERLGLRTPADRDPNAAKYTVRVKSTSDGTQQPCLFIPHPESEPRPLLVYLHPWRHGYDTDSRRWQEEARTRRWHFMAPHFRGPNKRPEACASRLARQDIRDAVDFARRERIVDANRIYAAGVSGGAHMALVMAAEAPDLWAAVSTWCAVSDLAAFHAECVAQGAKVYRHIEKCCGGAPGTSARVDDEIRYRSPRFHLAAARDVPLDINHGIRDGQPRGIGVQHSIWAFNPVAQAHGKSVVTDIELANLQDLSNLPPPQDCDATYPRPIYFRRSAGVARLTLFEGGHEDLPAPACAWLSQWEKGKAPA